MLDNKNIILGVTGSVAAYKAADIASRLVQAGAKVETVMTGSATKFITPLALRALTKGTVVSDMFDPASQHSIEHVTLGETADVVLIAPATASIIASLASGLADDMVSLTVLATRAPVVLAPAMDVDMYANPVTQENLARLRARGFVIVEPGYGRMASGKVGWGRLADVETIIGTVRQVMGRNGDLAGRQVVVTAGGTREPVDPVRHIGNRSSGRMGYAIAEVARDRGAAVTLITGPTSLPDPFGVEVVHVETAAQMKAAVDEAVVGADALVMAAAVADYRPKTVSPAKIKKASPTLALELVRTPDILAEVEGDFIRVGFAAESENLVENAREKLEKKGLDFIVANDITAADSGFAVDSNRVTIIGRDGTVEALPLMSKQEVAQRLLERVSIFNIEFEVKRSNISTGYVSLKQEHRYFFPALGKRFKIATDKGELGFEAREYRGGLRLYSRDLAGWLKQNGVTEGGRLLLKVWPRRDYHLQVVR